MLPITFLPFVEDRWTGVVVALLLGICVLLATALVNTFLGHVGCLFPSFRAGSRSSEADARELECFKQRRLPEGLAQDVGNRCCTLVDSGVGCSRNLAMTMRCLLRAGTLTAFLFRCGVKELCPANKTAHKLKEPMAILRELV